MRNYLAILLSLLVFATMTSWEARAEEKAAVSASIEMLDDATMEKLAASGELSDQQQLLASLTGTWYYELKYWTNEGTAPQISTGTATNEMILGKKYLLSKTSVILNIGGQNIPYESWETIGYDKDKKAFASVKADSMHDGFITGSGQYDEKLNAIEEKGIFKDPLDAKARSYRSILQWNDDGTYKRTFFTTGKSGKEFQVIEINFERR